MLHSKNKFKANYKGKRILVALMLSVILVGCKQGVSSDTYDQGSQDATSTVGSDSVKEQVDNGSDVTIEHPLIQIEMEDGSTMVFELYPEFAPNTVENFVGLVKSGFYDGLTFHRIIKGFMVQSGDPKGDGSGGSDTRIEGEFAKNGFKQNSLKHTRGILSMARSRDMNSASSQFFIMDGESSQLDGSYAAFGKLIEGEATLTKIAETEVTKNPMTGETSSPTQPVIVKHITVIEK